MPAPYRRLGRIVKTHGTKGEVSVALRDGISSSVLAETAVWVVPPPESGPLPRRVVERNETPRGTIVRLEGIESLAEAHELVGRFLLASGEETPTEATGTEALVGYEVHDERRGYLGRVTEVIHTGANDVLVLGEGPFGEVLVPVIPDVMGTVDGDGRLEVRLLEGLIDEEPS